LAVILLLPRGVIPSIEQLFQRRGKADPVDKPPPDTVEVGRDALRVSG
jgi:hypothetical protein